MLLSDIRFDISECMLEIQREMTSDTVDAPPPLEKSVFLADNFCLLIAAAESTDDGTEAGSTSTLHTSEKGQGAKDHRILLLAIE